MRLVANEKVVINYVTSVGQRKFESLTVWPPTL